MRASYPLNSVLKKRLVGTAVLLLLAGILWPLLFNFDSASDIDELSDEQTRESIDREINRLKQDTERIKSEVLGSPNQVSDQSGEDLESLESVVKQHPDLDVPVSRNDVLSEKSTDEQPVQTSTHTLDENKIPVSWVLQVGTFKQWENAEKLRDDLIGDNLRAFIRPGSSNRPPPYVLMVGPFFDSQDAGVTGDEIQKRYKTGKPILRRFKSGQGQ